MLFRKKPIVNAVDFHCHLLPKADHGSDSLETSAAQLKNLAAVGVTTIVATPHFYPEQDTVPEFLARRKAAYEELMSLHPAQEIVPAAEVAMNLDLPAMPELEKLCIGETNYILLEMPRERWTRWVFEGVYTVRRRGLQPILAHIDRYDISDVNEMLRQGVVAQVNGTAFDTAAGKRRYRQLFAEDAAQLLGSDTHGQSTEPEAFRDAIRYLGPLGENAMQNARAILAGKRYYER